MALSRVPDPGEILDERAQVRLSELYERFPGDPEHVAIWLVNQASEGNIRIYPFNDVVKVEKVD